MQTTTSGLPIQEWAYMYLEGLLGPDPRNDPVPVVKA